MYRFVERVTEKFPQVIRLKIYSKHVLLTLPLSYENAISDCSANIQNIYLKKEKKILVMQMLRKHSILSFC